MAVSTGTATPLCFTKVAHIALLFIAARVSAQSLQPSNGNVCALWVTGYPILEEHAGLYDQDSHGDVCRKEQSDIRWACPPGCESVGEKLPYCATVGHPTDPCRARPAAGGELGASAENRKGMAAGLRGGVNSNVDANAKAKDNVKAKKNGSVQIAGGSPQSGLGIDATDNGGMCGDGECKTQGHVCDDTGHW